jgi:protein TonB
VQTVELLGPPPPAPEELEPEPPLETEAETVEVPEVEMAQPGPEAAEPGDDRLGLDADAGGGSDAFGLLAKKGGREITSLGGSGDGAGGGSGLLLQAFVGSLRAEIQRELNAHLDLRRRSYVAIVKIWVADDGRIQRFEVSDPTGQPDIDEALERALAQLGRVADPPPGIPQPIWLRVRSSQLTEAASR